MKRISFFIIIVSFTTIFSCKKSWNDEKSLTVNPSQIAIKSKYFSEHTMGYISVKDGFTFRFNDSYSYERSKVEGIKIKPNISGQWQWLSDNTLAFTPEKVMDYGKEFVVSILLDKLLGADTHPAEPVLFHIATRKLRFSMNILGLKITQTANGEQLSVEGSVTTTDYANPELMEPLLTTSQVKSHPTIEWNHTASGQNHKFTIKNIKQNQKIDSQLKISWNGNKWDKHFKGIENILIKAKEKFAPLNTRLSNSPDQNIKMHFSNTLLANQNLSGLIAINGKTKGIKTSIKGNVLLIYPIAAIDGDFDLYISEKIKSNDGQTLKSEVRESLCFDALKPTIRLIGRGMIVPNTSESYMPLEVVNLKSLDIEIFKIFENNILQYLQSNDLNGGYSLEQVGRIVHREKIDINGMTQDGSRNKWTRVGLNLKDYISADPASIYQIRIGYQQAYAITDCDNQTKRMAFTRNGEQSMTTYTDEYYEDWENRDDPCVKSYYNPDRVIKQNLLLSDIGIIVKQGGQQQYHIAVNSISTGQSVNNATVSFFDFQQQLIMEGNTNGSGFFTVKPEKTASFIVVSHSTGHAYVKLNDQNSNSLTDFEVGGSKKKEGIDGFIYTDRGVHRPGDTVFLNFMLDDSERPMPLHHPVTLEVKDTKGSKKYEATTTEHIGRIYAFNVPTDANALTGQWKATIKVGAHQFSKALRIETVKPNRLKIEIEAPDEVRYTHKEDRIIVLTSRWLHGASADGLKAKMEASFTNKNPKFKGYDDYTFMDPARVGSEGLQQVFDGKLNNTGAANIPIKINPEEFPGKILANVRTKIFENGGNFSEGYSSFLISPFKSYIGINAPKNRWGTNSVRIGENGTFKVVSIGENGKKVAGRKLSVGIYNINWRWWYYQGERYNIYKLNSAQHKEAFYTNRITTGSNGELDLTIDFQDVEWGRKMIRICDEESGHCTGEFFYARGWGKSNVEEERKSLAKLNFTSNKKNYKVGETVKVAIPTEKGSRILISLETNDNVILKEWIEGGEMSTDYEFTATSEMGPNIYVHAIMVQSYDAKENDLPMRMYGVIPIKITDSATILQPKIEMASKLEPKENFTIKVSEENDNAMAYTIAIVDEGLLDLTNFNTPHPHGHFFAKQSLGVKTWDLYEYVMTGINGSVDRMITVGGDDDGKGAGRAKRAIRFKPVVMTAGPFYIHNGESRKHTFTMPNYLGSVRAMVVAKKDKSYGHSDKTVPVKTDIVILPTMPRVVGPGEEISIPVNVFANENHIKTVTVSIETTPHIELISAATQKVTFTKLGEKIVYFKARVNDNLGIAKVKVFASSGKMKIDQEIEIDIRNPNPIESIVIDKVLQPGENWTTDIELVGMDGTNEGLVELSALPSMNIQRRLDYLTSYPYGCVEQTTSAAFPQLSLGGVIDLSSKREKIVDKNINAAIRRLKKMQISNGGLAYWPGGRSANNWGTTYAGHFLIKAKKDGYYIPNGMLNNWADYQTSTARKFRIDRSRHRSIQQRLWKEQAYRLYTLALYGSPELPSMNVLHQEIDMPPLAQYLLAVAYSFSGKTNIAREMIRNTSTVVKPYNELGYTYGSDMRDMAIIAQTLMTLEKNQEAGLIIKRIAKKLSSNSWYSTQTLSHALLAVADYIGTYKRDDMKFTFDVADSGSQTVEYKKPVYLYSFNADKTKNRVATINNNSKDVLFARITMSGQKPPNEVLESDSYNRNITLNVKYTNMSGAKIDVSELERGTDFIAHVTVKNQNSRGEILDEIALTQIFPSGWEIQSGGLSNVDQAMKGDSYEYRDVRDDRVYTFFDLGNKKEYKTMLTATYEGDYFLPPISCEAMYDNEIQAKTKGMKVKVVTSKGNK
ncbi:MAG: MG2 domain-containing protein [Saprospiraceae bacterium]